MHNDKKLRKRIMDMIKNGAVNTERYVNASFDITQLELKKTYKRLDKRGALKLLTEETGDKTDNKANSEPSGSRLTDLEFELNYSNTSDSNLFLRKLWSELQKHRPNGWSYVPFEMDDNMYKIGNSNWGEVSYSFENRGCIKSIIFSNVCVEDASIVSESVEKAKNIDETITFGVSIELPIKIHSCCSSLFTTRVVNSCNKSYLLSTIEAYSSKDSEYLLGKKLDVICAIFAVYFNRCFLFNDFKVRFSEKAKLQSKKKDELYF